MLVVISESGDVEGATMLFRGCVHECDKLLRKRDGAFSEADSAATPDTETKTEYPPEFYLIYGKSLHALGVLAANEEDADPEALISHLTAAAERFNWGLAHAGEHDGWPLQAALGRVLLQQVTEKVSKNALEAVSI